MLAGVNGFKKLGFFGALAGLLGACGGLQLTVIKTAQQRPSNVAVYFKVENDADEPVGGLTADRFRIYEDDQLVSEYESKQTIANPEVAAVHYTLLLVDMSGSVSESGSADLLVDAVRTFTEHVEKQQRVALYAIDGAPELHPIVPFTDQPGSTRAGVQQLATYKPKDPSTNLNGAIVRALDELDTALGRASQPMKFGTLVVFTDGTDRANRVTADEMKQHIKEKPFDVFAIGLGAEIKESELKEIGKSGTAMAADNNAVVKAFDEIGARVESRTKSYYLLSYCSPSRAGSHVVRVEAVVKEDGDDRTGSLDAHFDATGFGPGCDPNTPPSFDVTKGDALAPPPEKESKRREREEKKDAARKDRPSGKPASPPPPQLPPPPPPPQSAPPPAPKPQPDFNP
jgi:hypothetical protein